MPNINEPTFTVELTLPEANAVTQSVSKTLSAEMAKIQRHAADHPITRKALANWRLLDGFDAQLREQMGEAIDGKLES